MMQRSKITRSGGCGPTPACCAILAHPNRMVWRFIPIDAETTYEEFDFFFEADQPLPSQIEAIEYIDQVLQKEDIDIVESVQRGMQTPAFVQGRFVCDIDGSGESEHAVHHFHSLYLKMVAGL